LKTTKTIFKGVFKMKKVILPCGHEYKLYKPTIAILNILTEVNVTCNECKHVYKVILTSNGKLNVI
jgi:hypothetical protein